MLKYNRHLLYYPVKLSKVMSKKQTEESGVISPFDYGYGYVIHQSVPSTLAGKLLTLVEAMGLRESQEKSVKDLVRQEVWNMFSTVDGGALWITPNLNTEIHRVWTGLENHFKNGQGNTGPLPGIPDNIKFHLEITSTGYENLA